MVVPTATETEALLLEAEPDQAAAPALQCAAARRQELSPHPGAHRPSRPPGDRSIAARGGTGGATIGPFASAGAVNRTLNQLQKAFLLRSCADSVSREPHPALPALPDPALLGPLRRADRPRGLCRAAARCRGIPEGRSQPDPEASCMSEMLAASAALEFERAAALRDRIRAMSQVQSAQAHQSARGHRGRRHRPAPGGRAGLRRRCSSSAPHQNWGNRAYFPRIRPPGPSRARSWRPSSPSSMPTASPRAWCWSR
ncbi:MAG: hypothetical protein KatS3mg118_3572 [Paracoccaceae bacterium]|nr:MAG: hypothetical protein KatS3mg118_3572 [Paracoccaceae bacterium]